MGSRLGVLNTLMTSKPSIKIVVCTGGFDPLHSGHIRYLEAAKQLGDKLIVGLNSDAWLERKKGRAFMPFAERQAVLQALSCTDLVVPFDDSDGSAVALLESLKSSYPYADIIFANGGDRTATNIPEMLVKDVEFRFSVGGADKANSSSWILEEWKAPKTERTWGYYRVLHDVDQTKVKELTLKPGASISYQKHEHRSEFWMITEGTGDVVLANEDQTDIAMHTLNKHEGFIVPQGFWHKLSNNGLVPLRVVEIQFGNICIEEDILRQNG